MNYEQARHSMIEQQLALGGRLIAFVALPDQAPTMALRCLTRVSADAVSSEDVLETIVPMLQQAPVKKFVY
jgi:hypothetical protein